eukprot:gene8280-10211_t
MEDIDQTLVNVFAELNLVQQTHEHAAAFTVEEQAANVGHLPGALTKNLFLRDKKYGLFLVTALSTRDVNMKTVASLLGLSGANLRLGDEELLKETLGVTRGSVSPLALVHDKQKSVRFCIDKALTTQEIVNVHPLRNDRTTSLSSAELSRFLQHIEHEPTVLDFDSASAAGSSSGGAAEGAKKPKKEAPAAAAAAEEGADGGKQVRKETLLGLS